MSWKTEDFGSGAFCYLQDTNGDSDRGLIVDSDECVLMDRLQRSADRQYAQRLHGHDRSET